MDLVGLFVFSVSMVIFGAYQAIPVLINRHDPGLHIRFRKGFGIGHMFGSANKAACLFPSSDKSAEIISKAPNTEFNEILTGFPLNFVTRTNATLISPPERVSDAQFGLHLSSLAAEKAKDFRLSVCGWVKRRLQSSSQVTKRKRPSLIHIRRNFDGTVLFGLGCISVAMFGIFLVAGWNLYRLYIASDAKSISKTPGSAQVDLSLVETIRRKKLFLECMGSLEETLSKLMRQMEEAVNQRQNEVETALTSVDALFDTDDDRQATDTILNDVSKAENQLISFSVIDDTLSNLVAALRTIVKTARHDLQVGIKDVKRVPPELAVPITQPTAQLRDDSLDDSAKAIKYETKRLEMVLMQMRAAIKSCMPGGKVDNLLRELVHDYKMLDEQAKITREHIHSVKLQLKRLKDVDVFEIQHKLLNAQHELTDLTNDSEDIAKFITESKKWQDQILNKVNEHVTEKIEKAEKKIHFSRRESSPEFRKEEVAAMIKEAMEGPYDPNDPKPQGEKAPEHEGHHDADEEDNADEGEELNDENNNGNDHHAPRISSLKAKPILARPSGLRSSRENRKWPKRYYGSSPSISRGRRTRETALLTHPFRPIYPTPPRCHWASTTPDSSPFEDCAIASDESTF